MTCATCRLLCGAWIYFWKLVCDIGGAACKSTRNLTDAQDVLMDLLWRIVWLQIMLLEWQVMVRFAVDFCSFSIENGEFVPFFSCTLIMMHEWKWLAKRRLSFCIHKITNSIHKMTNCYIYNYIYKWFIKSLIELLYIQWLRGVPGLSKHAGRRVSIDCDLFDEHWSIFNSIIISNVDWDI